jgi:DNA-binding transcriptional LysR family regulator
VGGRQAVRNETAVPLVLFPQGCIYRKRMIYALESAGRAWHIAYHSHSLAGVQAAVAAGLGVSLLPAFARLDVHAELGVEDGFAPVPPTELAIVGDPRAFGPVERDLLAALKQAIGQDAKSIAG